MPVLGRRSRIVLGLVLATTSVAAAAGAVRWGGPRFFPGFVDQARRAYARGDWPETAHLAGRRLKDVPDDPEALRLAARAAARQNRDQAAAAIYARLGVVPLDHEDSFLLGRSLSRTGRGPDAIKALESALKADPDHPETLDLLCRLYYQADRYFASAGVGERLVRVPNWEAKGRLMLALALAATEDPAGAARALERWLELDPKGAAAAPDPVRTYQTLLVRSLLKTRRPAKARAFLEPLLAAGPDPEASWLLSRTYIQEKDFRRAESALKHGAAYAADHPAVDEPAPFLGAARCAPCHREQSQSVLASRHATTFARGRDVDPRVFSGKPLTDPGNPQVVHTFERQGSQPTATSRAVKGVYRAVLDYAFGSLDHFTTFVGRDDRDRSFMIRMSAYESKGGVEWDLATALPPRPADDEEYLGNLIDDRDGARRCLSCHTTNFRAVWDETGPEALDHAVGCEKCHGPGGHHLAAVEAGFSDLAIGNPKKGSPAAVNHACAQCHGFPSPDAITESRTDPALYRFQSTTITWSRCFTESDGALSCATCHNPHENVETRAASNEAKCLSCHADAAQSPAARPDHLESPFKGAKAVCPVNPAKGCVECHMPQMWQQGSHSYKTDHFIRVRDKNPGKR